MERAQEVWEEELTTKSASTRRVYRNNLNKFLKRWELTQEELFERRRVDLESPDPRDRQSVERMVRVHMAEMHKEGYSPNTCRQISKAVTSFFEAQGLPIKIKEKDKPKGISNGQRIVMADQIKTMHDQASAMFRFRNRALLMLLKDSGLRRSDVTSLDVGHFLESKRVVQNGENFAVFQKIETEKTKAPAYIHIGPEATEALDQYLENERPDAKPEDPLFVDRGGTRFRANTLGQIFVRLGKKVADKGISAHSLRKFNTTALQAGGVHDSWIKLLQGKKIGGSMAAYTRPYETGDLTKAYIQAYPKLRIFGKANHRIDEQADEIKSLRRKNRELEAELAKRDDRLSRVEDQMTEVIRELRELKGQKNT